jgi:hypothetical protein
MTRVTVTFEFEAAGRDDALRQARWFMERRTMPNTIVTTSVTADGENLLTRDLLLDRYRFCVMCLSGEHSMAVHQ